MKKTHYQIKMILMVAALCTSAFAVTVRGSSGNGEDSNAPNWLLLGRTQSLSLSANGKKASMTREVVCLNQDVENAFGSPTLSLSGSCDSGVYMYIFQIQSTSTDLGVVVGRLSGFNPSDVTNFGVMICDSPGNTIEMCTNDPKGTHIPPITVTTNKTTITFTVPSAFPSYAAGTAQQGQGLAFFVITQQSSPLPISLPTVGVR